MHRLTDEMADALRGMTHMCLRDIAAELDVPEPTLNGWARRLGLTFVDGRGRTDKCRAAQARKRAADPGRLLEMGHLTAAEVAEALGVSRNWVWKWRHRMRLKGPGRRGGDAGAAPGAPCAQASSGPELRGVLRHLSERERADYRVLKKAQFTTEEALASIRRPDLIGQARGAGAR